MGTDQTPVYWVMFISRGVKLLGFSPDALCLHSAEIKNGWSYTSISAQSFLSCVKITTFIERVSILRADYNREGTNYEYWKIRTVRWSATRKWREIFILHKVERRSHWPRVLMRGAAAAGVVRLWVRILPRAWLFVGHECCVLSGRSLCYVLITRPEESYPLWCVVVCNLETSRMRTPWSALGHSAAGKKSEQAHVCKSRCILGD